jgi:hypothetical protein
VILTATTAIVGVLACLLVSLSFITVEVFVCARVCRKYHIFTVVHYHPVFTSISKMSFFLVVPPPKFGFLSVLPGGWKREWSKTQSFYMSQ